MRRRTANLAGMILLFGLGSWAFGAEESGAPLPGTNGAYRITFAIAWYQLFPRSHTWVCDVAPNGSVTLHADSGDVVP